MSLFRNYKKKGNVGLFDNHFAANQLSEIVNPLETINKVVDLKLFRSLLEEKNAIMNYTICFIVFIA